jgi:Ca-activated chloride channel family protein
VAPAAASERGDVVSRSGALALVLLATGASWLDPHATAREASRLYADGKFDDAVAKYREALIDDPDSPLLQFNLATAAYRAGKFDDAVAALGRVPVSDADPARTASVAYNLGNAKYRLGAAAEGSNPQQALTHYAEALVAYRRAMGADPADEDPKFNHEFVEKKLAELKKKLEEQKQQQDQPQPQDQQKQDGEKQDQAQQQEQQKDEAQEGEPKPDEQQGEDQQAQQEPEQQPQDQAGDTEQPQEQKQADEQQPAGEEPQAEPRDDAEGQPGDAGDAVAGDAKADEMSQREAEAILDGQRDQEMRPDEMARRAQRGRVAEPREDW